MPPDPSRRLRLAAAILAAGVCTAAGETASAQRIARQFDDQSAGATPVPAVGATGAAPATATNLVPHVPAPVSRPDSWAGGKRGGPAGDNHVLSSIRARPGDPLEPIDEADDAPTRDERVEPASFAEPVVGEDAPEEQTIDSTTVVARVGPEVVLESDLLTPTALEWLAKVSPGLDPQKVRELRRQICRQVLPQHVDSLIVFVDACRTIPEDRLPEIEKKVNEAFDSQQLPQMVRQAGLTSPAEYETLLRSRGQSLERVRKMFFERALAQQWAQQKVHSDAEIPHADMIAWYHAHLAEYDFPARAKFEQLTVRYGAKRPREEAWNILAEMGNDVLEGRPFEEVAKERSEGPSAAAGGRFDWTTKGSLVSKVIDEAIFSLPPGQLSAILEEPGALHIVRVVERTDAGRTPFIEAQVGIKEQLTLERRKKEMEEYLSKLRDRTPVWTIFDEEPGGVRTASASSPATAPRGGAVAAGGGGR